MQRLEVSSAVRPLKWSLGVKWLSGVCPVHIAAYFKIKIMFSLYVEPRVTTLGAHVLIEGMNDGLVNLVVI
jgi:hypothetical protein